MGTHTTPPHTLKDLCLKRLEQGFFYRLGFSSATFTSTSFNL